MKWHFLRLMCAIFVWAEGRDLEETIWKKRDDINPTNKKSNVDIQNKKKMAGASQSVSEANYSAANLMCFACYILIEWWMKNQ